MSPLLSIDSAATQRADLFPIDLETRAQSSLALVGQWHALFQVLTGEISVSRNAIRLVGSDARDQVISGTLGVLPSRFAWPLGFTVEQLLSLSAELLGMTAQDAARDMDRVLQLLQLTAFRQQKLSKLLPLQTRLVGLAHALLGSPSCLAVEDALLGLTTQESRLFLDALELSRQGCSLIVNVAHAAAGCVERLLIDSCEEVLILDRGAITLQGPPSQLNVSHGLFQITIIGMGVAEGGQVLRGALEARGVAVRSFTLLPQTRSPAQGPMARLVVELDPSAATLPLFAAAKSCNSTLLDLHALPNVE